MCRRDTPPYIVESDQAADIFVRQTLGEVVAVRLLSFRCQEAQTQGLAGQDYARVVSNQDGSSLCFCVCDGVGSSYNGGFAARYLAICLLDWLQTLSDIPHKSSGLSLTLQEHLDQWTREGQAQLHQLGIPSETPGLVREVLQELRDQNGSQTVFLCGRVDRTKRSLLPPSLYNTQAFLCWMGNVTARLFSGASQQIDVGERDNDRNRWSTVQGGHGAVATRVLTLKHLDRLIVYTDGLASIEKELASLSDVALQKRSQQLLLLPINDDMTLLDLQWFPGQAGEEDRQ